jgi:hypothetical protein
MAFCEECQMSQYTHYLEPVTSLLGPTLESPPEPWGTNKNMEKILRFLR